MNASSFLYELTHRLVKNRGAFKRLGVKKKKKDFQIRVIIEKKEKPLQSRPSSTILWELFQTVFLCWSLIFSCHWVAIVSDWNLEIESHEWVDWFFVHGKEVAA